MKEFSLLFLLLLPIFSWSQDFRLVDSIRLEVRDSITDFEADDFNNIYYIRNFSELNKIDNRARRKKSFSNQTLLENLNTQNVLQITVKSSLFDLLILDNQLNLIHDEIKFPVESNFSPTLTALVDNNFLWGYDPVLQRLVLWNYRDKKIRRQSVILSEKTGDEFYAELVYSENKIYLIGYHKILIFDEYANLEMVIPFQEFNQFYLHSGSVYFSFDKKIYRLNLKTQSITALNLKHGTDYFSINNDYLFVLNGKVVYLYLSQKQS